MTSPNDIITLALAEDVGEGDVTCKFFVEPDHRLRATASARAECVVAGIGAAREVFRRVDATIEFLERAKDGDQLQPGQPAFEVSGRAASILIAERTALNFLQRLSGVATLARKYVDAIAGTGVRILDTRKTTPGLRDLEKAAAAAGGVQNHRRGLYDQILVKDNHLALGLGWEDLAARAAKAKSARPDLLIEIEVDSLAQFRRVNEMPEVDIVLLDNMSVAELKEAVALRRPGLRLEASGGITLANIREVAETGVDFISVGAITHSAPAVDFGLDFCSGEIPG